MTVQLATSPRCISRGDIKALTKSLLKEHRDAMGWTKPDQVRFDLREIYETVLYPKYEYELITNMDLGFVDQLKVLGKVIMEDRVVLLDRSIAPPNQHPQFVFTMGHEFGHSILHQSERELFRCTSPMITRPTQDDILEIQANAFSENLLMPDGWVIYRFRQCYETERPFRYVGKGTYWFTQYGVSRKLSVSSYTDLCRLVGLPLCKYFSNTSKTSMSLKLHKLGLVQNLTREKWDQGATGVGCKLGDAVKSAFAGLR